MAYNNGITCFAPLERASAAEVSRQAGMLAHSDLTRLLNFVPTSILILNKERQTVFGNKALLDLLCPDAPGNILGLRMGELVKCRNAGISGDGCGTDSSCRYCGGINAMLTNIQDNVARAEECHLLVHFGGNEEALDLRVSASPFEVNDERFILCALTDIADEKAKISLERLLLHDILNAGLAVRGFSDLISEGMLDGEQREYMVRRITALAQQIIDEITARRHLKEAELDQCVVEPKQIETLAFLGALLDSYHLEAVRDRKVLLIDANAQSISMTTDELLLAQVIGSMIKNAIEGSQTGDTITVTCVRHNNMAHFSVTNPAFLPEQVRAQLFRRSSSTKHPGTGLGTYRMKYLTEKYLHGTITFVTNEQQGTTFTAAYPLEL